MALVNRGRRRGIALVLVGMVMGAALIAPAGAHIDSIAHTWKKHLLPMAKKVFYTKKQSNARFTNVSASTGTLGPFTDPIDIIEYTTTTTDFTDIATTSITTTGATSKVLVLGQFTAETEANAGDVFGRIEVDGAARDGEYWASLGHTDPGVGTWGRASLSFSRVITLGPGVHSVVLGASYYDGGTDHTVTANNRAVSAVELT